MGLLGFLVSMHRFVCLAILVFASSNGQFLPYGPTQVPFGVTADAFRPTLSPVTPPVLPFGPTPNLGSPYNNPYYKYNPALGPNVPILTYSNTQDVQGTYAFSFTTADGKQAQESGYLKDAYVDNTGEPQGIQVVQGSYAYISPDGTPVQVTYVADENGYRPSGVHINSDGKAPAPFSFPNTLDKDGKQRYVDPFYQRYNQYDRPDKYDRYDPYYRNAGRNYYGNRYDPHRYDNNYNDPARYYQSGSKYHQHPSRYYQDAYRHNTVNWRDSYPDFVPLNQDKARVDTKKD